MLSRGGRAWPNATGLGPVPFVGARVQISPPARRQIDDRNHCEQSLNKQDNYSDTAIG